MLVVWLTHVGLCRLERLLMRIKNLMEVTREAMYLGIEQALVGNRIGDIGALSKNTLKVEAMVSYVIWSDTELDQQCMKNQWFLTMAWLDVVFALKKEWS